MYDPTLPADSSPLSSPEMRSQLTGLRDLIDTIPQGDPGPEGPPGMDGMSGSDGPPGVDGSPGMDGTEGPMGPEGPMGADGQPGEVSQQTLDDAIATTPSNSNAVATLAFAVSDPPTQGEMQLVIDKLDELIGALQR